MHRLSTTVGAACLAALQVISLPAFAKAPPAKAPGSPPPASAPVAAPAPAQMMTSSNPGSAGDAIFLKDGSVLRGTLVELLPGDHCTLQLSTGQTATVQWGVILRVERAAAVSSTILVPSGPPQAAVVAESSRPSAMVHMDGDLVNLEQRSETNRGWTVVCTSPCDKSLPLESTYRLTGSGKTNSKPFLLEGKAGDHIILNVEAGSSGGLGGGIALTAIGGPILLIGLLVVAVGASVAASHTYSSENGAGIEVAGVVISGVGLAGLIPGIILITGNARTKESQQLGTASQAKASTPGRVAWGDELRSSRGPAPAPLPSIALFSGTF